MLATLFIGDHPRISRGSTRQQLLLDRAYNDDEELRTHVESIVGGSIQSLTVLKTDLVNDTTTVEVRYSRADPQRQGTPGRHRSSAAAGAGDRREGRCAMTVDLDQLRPVSLELLLDAGRAADPHRPQVRARGRRAAGGAGAAPGSLRVLEIDGRRRFAYRSTYFDTPALDAFHTSRSWPAPPLQGADAGVPALR